MKIQFSADHADRSDVLVLLVGKDGLARLNGEVLGEGGTALLRAAASGLRFDGDAGAVAETFVSAEGGARRVLLVGTGGGSDTDYEKAGGAITAKLLTSGATSVTVDFAGSGASATAAARLAAGAEQRAWRHDVYRTRQADKQKPTLTALTLVHAPDGSSEAFQPLDAVTQGLALTRTLVAEPPNVLYPETFVEQVRQSVDGLGLEITVLDEAEMRELGMGALLGVSQGSARERRLLALKWNGAGEGDPGAGAGRQGRDVRFRRHLDQARAPAWKT